MFYSFCTYIIGKGDHVERIRDDGSREESSTRGCLLAIKGAVIYRSVHRYF